GLQFVDRHLSELGIPESRCIPGLDSPDKITGKFRVTGANKKPNDLLKIVFVFEDQENRLLRIKQPPSPNRKNRRSANIQCARNVAPAEGEHRSGIDEDASFAFDGSLESLWRETRNAGKVAQYFRA